MGGGFGRYTEEIGQQKYSIWTKQNPKPRETLFYRTIAYDVQSTSDNKNYFQELETYYTAYPITSEFDNDVARAALANIHEYISSRSSDHKSYVTELFQFLKKTDNENIRLLSVKAGKNSDKVFLATQILRYAGIPARSMNGILLSRAKQNAELLRWTEVFINSNVIRFTPERHQIGMPRNILPWFEGDGVLKKIEHGGGRITSEFSVKRHMESVLTESIWNSDNVRSLFYKISVYNMPVEIQLIMGMLLLIPVGALVCVFLKQVIGITTYGTFMPVLIALSFRETELFWGIIFFSTIVIIGMFFRSLFDNMRLLLVPRLTAVLTIVVGIIFVLSMGLYKLGFNAGGLSLFPLIILTMMIERMSVTWEEQGAKTAITLAFNSMLIAVLCYSVIGNPYVEHIFVTFPELLFVVLGISLALGRYTGFKLTEYYRFRSLQ